MVACSGGPGDAPTDAAGFDAAQPDVAEPDAAPLDAPAVDAPAADAPVDAPPTDAAVLPPPMPPELTPVGCAGPTLTGDEMFTLFPPTLNQRFLNGTPVASVAISRTCSTVTGCSAWMPAAPVAVASEFRTVPPRPTFELLDASGFVADTTPDGLFVVSGPGSYLHQRFAPGADPSTVCKEVLVYTDVATSATAHRETWTSSRSTIAGPFTTTRTYRSDPFADLDDPLTTWCPGPTTNADIIGGWFPAGAEVANLSGTVDEVVPRRRYCDDLTGCTPFADTNPPVRYYGSQLLITGPASLAIRVTRQVGTNVNVTAQPYPLTAGVATGAFGTYQIAARVTPTCAVVRSRYDILLSVPAAWEQTYAIHAVHR